MEWKEVKLQECTTKIGSGATPLGGSTVYTEHGIAFIRSQNVYNSYFQMEGLAYIKDHHAQKLNYVTVQKKDILLNITGDSVARCCIVPNVILPARVSQHVAIIRTIPEKLNPNYLQYYLVSSAMQDYMLALANTGSTRSALTKETIEKFIIPLPPLPIQRKIAAVLSAYDELIENNRQRIAILEKMAEELYQEWFVRLRFPGYEHTQIIQGIPEGWSVKKLGEIIKFDKGKTPDLFFDEKTEENEIYLDVEGIEGNMIKFAPKHNAILCVKDETLMIMDGARSSFVFNGQMGIVSSTFAVIRTEPQYRYILYEYLSANREMMLSNNTGSAIPHSNKKFIIGMSIQLPQESILNNFNTYYHAIFTKICSLKTCCKILTRVRDQLLSRLMSGALDVQDLDIRFPLSMQQQGENHG